MDATHRTCYLQAATLRLGRGGLGGVDSVGKWGGGGNFEIGVGGCVGAWRSREVGSEIGGGWGGCGGGVLKWGSGDVGAWE